MTMPVRHTLRGFAMYAEFNHRDYPHEPEVSVSVQESSLAAERKVWVGAGYSRIHLSEDEARIIRDALTEFLSGADRPNMGQKGSTMKTIEEVAAEVAADWRKEGKTRASDLRLAIEAIRAWEAQCPQDDEIYIVTDEDGEVADVFSTEEEAKLFTDDRTDLHIWEETVWAPGAYTAEHEKIKAAQCDECNEPATNHWPNLKEPVQMCDSCTHNARRSGWEPGQ